ncbi:MAG: CCA tRNA nucleotidyltransferase [Nannocystaceae bacterium]|nr:tRNA cytidylyltransferase [bacterium]
MRVDLNRGAPPADLPQAHERLRNANVPAEIVDVAGTLQSHGHAAVLVGGAVRDVLLGLGVSDWDLATSATPTEVQQAFWRTVPTGIDHGTVSVLVRQAGAEAATPVEVTTFRGEGTYEDGRRPTEVTFLRDLEDDLARRDFTVNALAWDPVQGVFSDPFGGLEDLRAGIVRAVGDPSRRFLEDGLRTMRAVRFCATRTLELEPQTQAAIGGALHVLDKVSRERVLVELHKLLLAPKPSRGLRPMVATGMWSHVLPAVPEPALRHAIDAVDDMEPAVAPRLARLLRPRARQGGEDLDAVAAGIDALKPSKSLRADVMGLVGPEVSRLEAALGGDAAQLRRAAASVGRGRLQAALAVIGADEQARATLDAALRGAPLSVGELAIKGGALIGAGLLEPGPAVGETMRALLAWVHEDPARNDPDALVERVTVLAARPQ